jgi:hypothetical protein
MSNFTYHDLIANEIPFVHSFTIEEKVCDGLVDYYNESPDKKNGKVAKNVQKIDIF